MKMSSSLICISLSLIIFSCTKRDIRLSGDFERGSLGNLEEITPGFFRGNTKHWIESDSIGNQYYWFYFSADHVKDRTVTFELTNLIGVYRGNTYIVYTNYTEPVYSYDQDTWERITEVSYDSARHTFRFSQAFDKEPVWIAFAHPYTYSRLQGLINSLKDLNVFISSDDRLDSLASVINKYWPIRTWHSEFKGSSCAWMIQKGIPNGTIELSQPRIGEGPYLTVDDYLSYGKGTALAITEFFGRQ